MKKIVWVLLLGIIILASILRFWQLGHVPISPDWDEVSLGYNAYSILHTARDEYGASLPIVLKSYGDYKPAGYAYLDIPAVAVFGLNTFAVRFPSAFFGVLTVLLTFFLVKELFKRNDMALLSSFLLAISPWHIQFSRVAFETNVGVFFNVLGALLFLKGLRKPWLLALSVGAFSLNLYVYQSEKVFTPLLLLLLCLLFYKTLLALPKKFLIAAVVTGVILIAPIAFYTLFSPNGIARAQGVSVFSSSTSVSQEITKRYEFNKATHDKLGLLLDNGRLVYAKEIVGNYMSHFNLNWLFITGDITRHHAPDMGILYLWELPFIFIGVYQLIFANYDKRIKLLVLGWFLLAPLPAAITQDVPHAVRTMNFLPIYPIITAIGLVEVFRILRKRKVYMSLGLLALVVTAGFNFIYYLNQYFVQQNYFDAVDWQYGYAQLVPLTQDLGKSYQHIVVSDEGKLSQSYMFYLFYLKFDPSKYQHAGNQIPSAPHTFGKYVFRAIDWAKDKNLPNTLFVGNPSDFPSGVAGIKQIITVPDGTQVAEIVGK